MLSGVNSLITNIKNEDLKQVLASQNTSGLNIGNLLAGNLCNSNVQVQQQANTLFSIAKIIMNLLQKFLGKPEAQQAAVEVGENSKDAVELTRKENRAIKNFLADGVEIENALKEQNGILETAQKVMQETQEKIEAEQERINAQLEEIEKLQGELANTTDRKEQVRLLNEIQGLSGEVSASMVAIDVFEATMKEQSEIVEKAVELIATLNDDSVEVVENAQSELASLTAETLQEEKEGAVSLAKAGENTATATAATTAAAAATGTVVAASQAPKLIKVAGDQGTAAATRLGSVATLTQLAQGLGQIGSDLSTVANMGNAIGSYVTSLNGLVGGWDSSLNSMITSIGSFKEVETSVKGLVKAVEEDLQNIDCDDLTDETSEETKDGQIAQNNENEYKLKTTAFELATFKLK